MLSIHVTVNLDHTAFDFWDLLTFKFPAKSALTWISIVCKDNSLNRGVQIWISFSELELPEDDQAVGAGTPCEYIESPMSDGTIEEDFEKALAREVADRRLSEDNMNVGNLTLEGTSINDEDFSDIARHD